jgi:hypothetical protein
MSDAPLTEKSLFDFMSQIDKKLSDLSNDIDKKLAPIKKDLQDVKNFQKYEADAIEYEVQLVLQKHLEQSYNVANIKPFPMKNLSDTAGIHISELDAAFLIKTVSITPEDTFMFVLAEAKHYIHRGKVAQKLQQFERMVVMFRVAHKIPIEVDVSQYNPVFVKTVQRNKFLTAIQDWKLYFGALYWEKQLAEELQSAIKQCKGLCFQFSVTVIKNDAQQDSLENQKNKALKLKIYNDIKSIERTWFASSFPVQRTDDEILQLKTLDCILEKVDIIIPSGNRYSISGINKELQTIGGSNRKTRRASKPCDLRGPEA